MQAFTDLMNGTAGRIVRILLGVALIYLGLAVVGGTAGYIVAVVGLVPIALGVTGRCLTEFLPFGR